uniref:Protein Abitram n=1 Tax=Ditylenchus dipsaci TaxID=166011 RepID=A0A915E9M8_9BILA
MNQPPKYPSVTERNSNPTSCQAIQASNTYVIQAELSSYHWTRKGKGVDRSKLEPHGKNKKGGLVLSTDTRICLIRCTDGTEYTIRAGIRASMVEVNDEQLNAEPILLERHQIVTVSSPLFCLSKIREKHAIYARYQKNLKQKIDMFKSKSLYIHLPQHSCHDANYGTIPFQLNPALRFLQQPSASSLLNMQLARPAELVNREDVGQLSAARQWHTQDWMRNHIYNSLYSPSPSNAPSIISNVSGQSAPDDASSISVSSNFNWNCPFPTASVASPGPSSSENVDPKTEQTINEYVDSFISSLADNDSLPLTIKYPTPITLNVKINQLVTMYGLQTW